MGESINRIVNYLPVLLMLLSMFFSYLIISYRKQDWVTGGLLLSGLLPMLFVQAITVLGCFVSKKKSFRRLFFIIETIFLTGIIFFYLIYVAKYN
jgi:hypothetical protein